MQEHASQTLQSDLPRGLDATGAEDVLAWEPSLVFLRYSIAVLMASAISFLAVLRYVAPDQTAQAAGPIAAIMVALAGWWLLARGSTRAAVNVLAMGTWVAVTGISILNGGVRTPVIVVYPLVVILIGWLISQRAALIVGGLTALTIVGFVVAEWWGILPKPPPTQPLMHGMVQVLLIFVATTLIVFLVRSYQNRLSELHNASRDLEQSRAELQQAQAIGNIGSWAYDPNADTLRLSAEACRIYGLREGSAINSARFMAPIHAEDRDAVALAWQGARQGGAIDLEYRITVGGDVRWLRQKADQHPAVESGLPLVGITQDITERKQDEAELGRYRHHLEELVYSRTAELAETRDAAEAASRAKSAFLANMSHELRTPMNAIMGMTRLAQRRATDPAQIDYLGKSMDAAQHLLALIDNVLDISKIEADRLTLEERDFSLSRMIDGALAVHEDAARAKGLEISRKIDPDLPELLCGDDLRLRQILLNLLANAVKFSAHGNIAVRARAVGQDSVSLQLRIEVGDQGIGIGPEQQARLFQAFAQGDDSMTRRYGGTGLGLAISRRIALLMDGDIGVTSQEGLGSTFWVTVRLRRASEHLPEEVVSVAESPRETLAKSFAGRRILLVEDEPLSQEVAMCLLQDAGLVPDLACNGLEALERAGGGKYALILMDVQMPVMNGLDATWAIRQLPGMSDIPIVAMSVNTFDQDRDACLAAGMNAHLAKPVMPDSLYAVLLAWLQKSATSIAA